MGETSRDEVFAMEKSLFKVTLLVTTSFWVFPLMSQTPSSKQPTLALPLTPQVGSLIEEVLASNSQDGMREYTSHLTKLFIGDQMGDGYIAAVSRRLAMAELMSRNGKRKWIAESTVVQAFNDLMTAVAAAGNKPIHTDTSVVHELRVALYNTSTDLSSVNSHESECLPTEAILLMVLLQANNGNLNSGGPPALTVSSHGGGVTFSAVDNDARSLLLRYAASHSHPENLKLYDHVTRLMGF